MHLPINHPLRPVYRALSTLVGLYVLGFGVTALVVTWGDAFFGQDDLPRVLGLSANPAFSVLSILVGLVLVLALLVDNNVDQIINLAAGVVFVLAGMAMMTLLRTELNFLGFSMTNVNVSLVLGTLMFTSGLYLRVGSSDDAQSEEDRRHGLADVRAQGATAERPRSSPVT